MRRLLRLLRTHADAVEAALFPLVDLRDHYRYQPGDPRYLSLRRMCVLIRWLPPGNPIEQAVTDRYWTPEMTVIDDTRRAIHGLAGEKKPKPHPNSPHSETKGRAVPAERQALLRRARARAIRRRQQLERG